MTAPHVPAPSFYDDIAKDYDAHMARMPGDVWARAAFQDFVARALSPGTVVLDFGCGTGIDMRAWAARGCRVVGYDSSTAMIDEAKKRCHAEIESGRVEVFAQPYAEFLSTPWTAARPTVITANFAVLNLVPSLREAFARFHEILEPGGRVFLSLLNPCHVRNFTAPGLRRPLLRALLHGVTEFPFAKVPTLLYRERAVRRAARGLFRLERRAGVGAIVNYEAIAGTWGAARGWRERIEQRLFFTRAMAAAGKFTFLDLEKEP